MILSRTPKKKAQMNALQRAKCWAGNFAIARRAVIEAHAAYPISEIQWYNLSIALGHDKVVELRRSITGANP